MRSLRNTAGTSGLSDRRTNWANWCGWHAPKPPWAMCSRMTPPTVRRSDFADDHELLEALRCSTAGRAAPSRSRVSTMANDPGHPSLQFKCVSEQHAAFSVRIGIHWRALGYRDDGAGEVIVT